MKHTPEQIVKAHQYLYYVRSEPIVSDYDYDKFCQKHGIDGHGGSDLEASYSDSDRSLAQYMIDVGDGLLSIT